MFGWTQLPSRSDYSLLFLHFSTVQMPQMDARLTVCYLRAWARETCLQCAETAADCALYCTALQTGVLPCETTCVLRLQAPEHSGSDDQFDPALRCLAVT